MDPQGLQWSTQSWVPSLLASPQQRCLLPTAPAPRKVLQGSAGQITSFHPSQAPLLLHPTLHNLNFYIYWEFRNIHRASFTSGHSRKLSLNPRKDKISPSAPVLVQGKHDADGKTLKINAVQFSRKSWARQGQSCHPGYPTMVP